MPIKKTSQTRPNFLLRRARQECGWSQQELADMIGSNHAFMISRWENGTATPGPDYRKKLCAILQKTSQELGFTKQFNDVEFSDDDDESPIYDPMIPFRLPGTQPFVGRAQLLGNLVQQICDQKHQQLISLYGLPGIGKTTLAMEIANDNEVREYFQDGILWAALGPQANVLTLLNRWGRLLGLDKDQSKSLHDDNGWAQALHNTIGTRRILFILDDAWNIEDALKCKVGGPLCSYLLTTRQPAIATQFAGTQALQIPELSLNNGIQLLTQIAPPLAKIAPDAPRSLVQSVGGLPLALTLIGNYLLLQTRHAQHRRTQDALTRLQQAEERLRLELPQAGLERDYRLLPQTPFTLQTIIHMSEARLNATQRLALSALALFPAKPNTFSEEAALSVAAVQPEILDQLVDTGLVEINHNGRYQLHQVITDYERLQGTNQPAEERLVNYIITIVEEQNANHALLEQELNNIIATLQLAYKQKMFSSMIRGALAISKFLSNQGLHPLSEKLLKLALSAAKFIDDNKNSAFIARDLANLYRAIGNYELAETHALESLLLLRQYQHAPEIQCEILANLGHIHLHKSNDEQAKAYLYEGLAIARARGFSRQICRLLGSLGIIVQRQGHLEQAEAYWKEALTAAREIEDPEILSYILGVFGAALSELARFEEAEIYLEEGLSLAQQNGSRPETCFFLIDLGDLASRREEDDKAEHYFQTSLNLARQMNLHPALSIILSNLGELATKRHEDDKASKYLQEGLEFALQKANKYFISVIYAAQGNLYLQKQELEQAKLAFEKALAEAPTLHWILIATAHYGLARVALLMGNVDAAQEHGEKSLRLFERAEAPQVAEVQLWLQNIPS